MTNLLCLIGLHKWEPVKGTERSVYISKWQQYLYALGVCRRCHAEHEIRKEVWY